MKNTITLNANNALALDCLDAVYDGTNTLYLAFITSESFDVMAGTQKLGTITPANNTLLIDSSKYLEADLVLTINGSTITIKAPETAVGNMTVTAEDDATYQVKFYAPSSGGSDVSIIPTLHEGTKIADFTIDGIPGELFAPNGGGGSITYGYALPTGGEDGDAYVQIQDEVPADPKATLSASNTHNNFEITNFSGNNNKYSFDISGTVDETAHNYSIINIDDLKVGGQYKVSFTLAHDVAQENLNVSYSQSSETYSKSFGIFVNNSKDSLMDLTGYSSPIGDLRELGGDIRYVAASAAYAPKGSLLGDTNINNRHLGYQGFLKKAGSRQYDFYFDATQESMSLGFVFDDVVNGTNCTASVSDMEVTYIGKPIKSDETPINFSYNANSYYSEQYSEIHGCDDRLINGLAWVCWGGDAGISGSDTIYAITFNTPQEFERVRLNISQGLNGYEPTDTLQNIFVEASTDDKAWDDETKEWINITGHSEGENVVFKNYAVDHLYLDVDKDTYKNIRVRYHNPTAGFLDDIQVYKKEEIISVTSIKDLYFKIDGVWKVYPNDPEDEPIFTYGSEDPDDTTSGDIYAKINAGAIDSISYKVDGTWLLGPSGGGGGDVWIDVLYEAASTTAPSTITLSNEWEFYDKLEVTVVGTHSSKVFGIDTNAYFTEDFDTIEVIGGCSDISYIWYSITNGDTLTKLAESGGYYIKSIRGISYHGQP